MKTLSIIGCGKVGMTLGFLWAEKGVFRIGDILNRSKESSLSAAGFIGAGNAVSGIDELGPADVFLIGTPDSEVSKSCNALSSSGIINSGSVVFHCSGALSSGHDLASAQDAGALVASIHPIKSFANPEVSSRTFEGTFCGVEGDRGALEILCPAFRAIGARTFAVDPSEKTIYHAATVIVCNYLTALLEFGIQAYAKAGLNRDTATQVMEPIVRGTVENIFRTGTVNALTGPIARGDTEVVQKQLKALSDWEPRFGRLYRDLGAIALELSSEQGSATRQSIAKLVDLLAKD